MPDGAPASAHFASKMKEVRCGNGVTLSGGHSRMPSTVEWERAPGALADFAKRIEKPTTSAEARVQRRLLARLLVLTPAFRAGAPFASCTRSVSARQALTLIGP